MESRSHRAIVLAIVVVLHFPLLWWLLAAPVAPRRAPDRSALIVEFLLQTRDATDAPSDPSLHVRRRRSESAPAPSPPPSRALRVVELPPATDLPPASLLERNTRLLGDDGRIRISQHLMDELDAQEAERAAQAARDARTYTIPLGDQRLLERRPPSIAVDETRFSRAWKPGDMNPIEEACWKNKGLALVMSVLGSMDCAYPGSKPKPVPAMIHYGRDDGETILRKTKDWEDYERR
jgi:hypothetical protein